MSFGKSTPKPEWGHSFMGNCWKDTKEPRCLLHGRERGKCEICPSCGLCEKELGGKRLCVGILHMQQETLR